MGQSKTKETRVGLVRVSLFWGRSWVHVEHVTRKRTARSAVFIKENSKWRTKIGLEFYGLERLRWRIFTRLILISIRNIYSYIFGFNWGQSYFPKLVTPQTCKKMFRNLRERKADRMAAIGVNVNCGIFSSVPDVFRKCFRNLNYQLLRVPDKFLRHSCKPGEDVLV